MITLLDTNILTRAAQPGHPMHSTAVDSVAELVRRGEVLSLVPRNLYEFWVVATRPTARNGLGMTPDLAHSELIRLGALFNHSVAVLRRRRHLGVRLHRPRR